MKAFRLIALLTVLTLGANAQEVKFPALDSSPADIVYYPLNVAKSKDDSTPLIKVIYSRPSKKGREIFGVLEQYGKIWRLGANESTEIRFYKPAVIEGKKIKAGTYSLFAIPNKDKWVLIFNKQLDKWGAFTYNQQKDVMRVEVPVKALAKPQEILAITFIPAENGARLIIAWDSTQVELPIGI
ncbi:DUF2911 domain-containing protein [Pedobacter frigoris]|uniref:DUF2911 domain-containing protein n=1 Tax=Pedobacter frigoris TaxID=2571272 RepID=A0A4U1CI66_9SPHI|nr:DUF2911 domain-containing protein [Pedobacter frigoris]TKC04985.1 DUF2911 domain-containing protein [Pedobacter frigoris]